MSAFCSSFLFPFSVYSTLSTPLHGKTTMTASGFEPLTQQCLHFVLFRQDLYLSREFLVAGQRGPAEEQDQDFGTGERLREQGESLGLFVYIESCAPMLQDGAQGLQIHAELGSLQTRQPDRRRSRSRSRPRDSQHLCVTSTTSDNNSLKIKLKLRLLHF